MPWGQTDAGCCWPRQINLRKFWRGPCSVMGHTVKPLEFQVVSRPAKG